MYMSRVTINPQRRESKAAAANINRLHAQVMNALPKRGKDASTRSPLWRMDRGKHEHQLYIVSDTKPDLRAIHEGYGWDSIPGESKDYSSFLDMLNVGDEFNFRLTANPTFNREMNTDKGVRVVRTPHRTPYHQNAWLRSKGNMYGFEVLSDPLISPLRTLKFTKNDVKKTCVTVGVVTFDGALRVTDIDAFRDALSLGIGRSKAYGCGLITVSR